MTSVLYDRIPFANHSNSRFMLETLRTATLRYDTDTQGTLLTLLLRNFIHYKLYDQADNLVSRTTFPESSANNLFARYLYYLGRIRAIQLDYSMAHQQLLTAIRKAPQQNKAAAGFLQSVHKFSVVVELLMGDIPERSLFRQPMLEKVLAPYSQIVQGPSSHEITNNSGANWRFGDFQYYDDGA
jgi:26S proteasome regulatory subunit N3